MRRVPQPLDLQLYWRYIAPNEPGRVPKNSPRRIARRANGRLQGVRYYQRGDNSPLPSGHLRDWRRGIWSTRYAYPRFLP